MEMQQQGDTHSVEPCDVCGDVGYPEVIAACTKCKVARAHVYCMKVFLKMVPDDWICETCDSGNDTVSLKYAENKNFSRDPGFDTSDIAEHENMHSTSPCKMHNSGLQTCSRSQKVGGTGKVKFIPEEEAIRLCGGKVSSKSFPANSSMHKMYGQSKNISAKVSSMNVKPTSIPPPVGHGKLSRHSGAQKTTITNQQTSHSLAKDWSRECDWRDHSSSFIKPVNKGETFRANALKGDDKASYSTQASPLPISTEAAAETLDQELEKLTEKEPCAASQVGRFSPLVHPSEILDQLVETPNKKEPSAAIQVGQSLPVVDSGVVCANGEYDRSNVDKRDLGSIQMNFMLYRCCMPSSYAAWKGGFKFQNAALRELYDGLEAFPPCTVHCKAFYYACKLPSVVEVQPLPISSFLIDLFQNDCPGLQDVALYFFPSDNCERSRQDLNDIFEFLDAKNAMLRGVVDGVELLVFTSKQLNEDSQGSIERLNAKNFLWGVFRLKEGRAIEELTDTEAVDMDIDMVGGQDVLGRVDSVQNRKDKPGNFSINSGEGIILQKTSEKAKDNKISLPTDLRKNIKTEFPFDKFPLKCTQDYDKIMNTRCAPPGFEGVRELNGSKHPSLKSESIASVENRRDRPGNFPINSGEGAIRQYTSEKTEDKKTLVTSSGSNLNVSDKPSLSADLRKNMKVEFPFDKFPLKSVQDYHKIMNTRDAPPGFEAVQEESLQHPSLKLKSVYDLYGNVIR
ncbi:uncharacterized protein LOC114753430 [Neltuma alba]|uniref:uncharacterized protein LOC114721824 n=1 Tax=Neltuma alba TaxID=207710 RepID=UPI0010A52752|nr:uncharacterized protein LOC114721824 [Prosopis alba]XP_028797953.1 uncharacterized protein LOC114753430 [Prosopis alba]